MPQPDEAQEGDQFARLNVRLVAQRRKVTEILADVAYLNARWVP
jgi:hypothetical protein